MRNILLIMMFAGLLGACSSVMEARHNSITEIQERRKSEDYIRYRALLKAKIQRNLKSPYECEGSGVVRFAIKIDNMGNIIQANYVGEPRGQDCIRIVEQAIRGAAPFPEPPASLHDEAISKGFLIQYNFKGYKEWKPPAI